MQNGTILTDGNQIYKIEGLNVITHHGQQSSENIIILESKNVLQSQYKHEESLENPDVYKIIPETTHASDVELIDENDENVVHKLLPISSISRELRGHITLASKNSEEIPAKRTNRTVVSNEYAEPDYEPNESDSDGSLIFESSEKTSIQKSKSKMEDFFYEDDGDDDVNSESDNTNDNNKRIWNGKIVFPGELIKDSRLVVRGKKLMKLMSKFYRLECDLCPEQSKVVFKKINELFSHYTNAHSIKGYVLCCGTKLIKPRAMAMHMCRHVQPEAFKCTECGKLMTCPKILQYHMQNHLPEDKRPLACPDCPRRFSYGSALVAHAISHQPEEERASHICDECGKSFSSPGRLSTHISVVHTKHDQVFVCHICAKKFVCKGNLVYHLTTHQPRVHQVQCEQCGKWLKNKLCLRKHMIQHSGIKYLCQECDYTALNPQCLRNHMRVQHTNLKPFACDLCDKTFKLKNTLLNHLVQHTGIKKFSCQFCSRTFASSGNYYSHRKRMHPQELAVLKNQQEEEERLVI